MYKVIFYTRSWNEPNVTEKAIGFGIVLDGTKVQRLKTISNYEFGWTIKSDKNWKIHKCKAKEI